MSGEEQPEYPISVIFRARGAREKLPVAECLEDTKAILRAHAVPMFAASLLGYITSIAIEALAAAGRAPANASPDAVLVLLVLNLILSVMSEAAIIWIAAQPRVSSGQTGLLPAYRTALVRLPFYVFTAVLALLLSALGLFLFILPGIVAIAAFAFWRQAVMLENAAGSRALVRSGTLALPVLWPMVGLLAVIGLARLAFVEPAVLLMQGWGGPAIAAFMKHYERAIDAVVVIIIAWRVVVEPPILAFMTALYGRLGRRLAEAAEAAREHPLE